MIARLFTRYGIRRTFYVFIGAIVIVVWLVLIAVGAIAMNARSDLFDAVDGMRNGGGGTAVDRLDAARRIADPAIVQTVLWVILGLIVFAAGTARIALNSVLVNPVRRLITEARSAATGDLTVHVERELGNEYGDLQEAFGEMIGSIRVVVGEIDAAAVDLQEASGQMAATSDEAGRSVGEVARAISSISEGAAHQVDLVTRAQEVVAEIDVSIGETAQNATLAQQESSETRELAQEGVDRAAEVQSAMNAVRASALSSAEVVQNLGEKSGDIDQIVSTITEIAGQTNLLALNAAIEAARAGEQGRGFAVVADEVRQLAEDSQRAAGSIAALIKEIQSETGHAVDAMREGVERVEAGSEVVSRNRQTFADIQEAVERFHDRSTQISALADRLRSDSDRVRRQIEDVAAVAEQSSASTEQVSASTEETSAAAEQVSASAQSVANTAVGLAALAKRFKIVA